jgi:hypothetical protein
VQPAPLAGDRAQQRAQGIRITVLGALWKPTGIRLSKSQPSTKILRCAWTMAERTAAK